MRIFKHIFQNTISQKDVCRVCIFMNCNFIFDSLYLENGAIRRNCASIISA
jgi:hypothetical protein